MEGGLPVCPTDFSNLNKYRKLHFKLKHLPRQRRGRCLFSITLMFNRVVFLCSGADISDPLLMLLVWPECCSKYQSDNIGHVSCEFLQQDYFFCLPAAPKPY